MTNVSGGFHTDSCRAANALGLLPSSQAEGLKQISPGQRPGSKYRNTTGALKGRHKLQRRPASIPWGEVRNYMDSQEHHHRRMTFPDELRALFRRQGIEFEERYV